MAGTYHSVGQLGAVLLHADLSSVLFQPSVELLQIVLRQLVQRYLTDLGKDVIIDAVLVVLLSQRADGGLAEVLIPEVNVVAEEHIRLAILIGDQRVRRMDAMYDT